MPIEKITVVKEVMKIDTRKQRIDIQKIENRRFMYHPETGILVLGKDSVKVNLSSHAKELADAGITEGYDCYIRGWIGTGRNYPVGVIHFAPNVNEKNVRLFDRAFATLEMFVDNGAASGTIVRGFGNKWEQPMSDLFPDAGQLADKPSIRNSLKKQDLYSNQSSHISRNRKEDITI